MEFKNRTLGIRVATVLVVLLASCAGLWGQATTTSSVIGLVTDSTNAAIPGADVTLTDLGTKISQKLPQTIQGDIFSPTSIREHTV